MTHVTLCTTGSTSVHLDHSCRDLAHSCLYLLGEQSHIFCGDYPQLLHSEVFFVPTGTNDQNKSSSK